MIKKLETILYNKWSIIAIYLILLKPLLFYYYPIINNIFNILMIIVGFIIIIYFVINVYKTQKVSKFQVFLLFYILILFISTILGTKDYGMLFRVYGKWFIISIYTEMLVLNARKTFFLSFSLLLMTLICSQLLSVIIYPNGMLNLYNVQIYFLGNENTTTITLLFGVFFLILKSILYEEKLNIYTIISIAMVTIIFIKTWSATAIIGLILMYIYLIFFYKKQRSTNIFNFRNYFILSIIIFLLLVVFRLQNMFAFIIEGVLHKDLFLSGRVFIWDACFSFIKQNPLIGLGVQEFSTRFASIGIYHAHCNILNILLEGGILALGFFTFILKFIWKKLKENINHPIVVAISFAFLIYFITGTVEVFQESQLFYIFMILGIYSDVICKECNHEKNISCN